MKKSLLIWLILLVGMGFVFAHGNFNETKQLVDSGISCSELADEQLEEIGDYYMEQMHPGESHELMHKIMGLEEGSEIEKQFHINMAKQLYCNENTYGMMSGGMMNMMGTGNYGMGYGMMGNYGYGYWGFINILYITLLIGLIILVYLWILKLLKNTKNKKG